MFLTLKAVGARVESIGIVGIVLVLTAVPLPAQRSGSQSTQSNPETTRLDDVDQRSTLQSLSYRTPCLSVNIIGSSPIEITDREVSNRAELRLRAAGLKPVPFENCGLPDDRIPGESSKVATREQMDTVWLSVEPWFQDASTFSLQVKVFRFVKWRVGDPTRADDGFRARLLTVDGYSEPILPSRRLRHEGRASAVIEAVDRLMDGFLVQYLRANQR